jgi:exonuclease SbcC
MLPLRLEIRNFLPYVAPDALRFDGIHLACLTGQNGAGKSSLLDAMTWVLWGNARARRDEDLIYLGQQDMYVQLDFEQEGQVYRVIRKRSRRQRGTGTLDLLIADENGDFRIISEPSMRGTQDKINRLLRLDYETFTNSAFLQQGKADAFTTKTPKERKQILSDILGLAQWEKYEEAAKEKLKAITNELTVIDLRIREIDAELAKEPGLQAALEEAEQAQIEAKEALEAAEKRLEEVGHVPTEMKNVQSRLADDQRRVRERERDIEAIKGEIQRQQDRINTYEAIIASRDEIQAGYAALQSAREADHALGDKLIQLSDFEVQQRRLENQLRDARAELENEASSYAARIAELEQVLSRADTDDLDAVQAEVIGLRNLEAERSRLQEQVGILGEERAGLDATNKTLRAEMNELKDRLNRLSAADAICPLCGQELDDKHRAQLIEQLTGEGKQRGDTYRANESRLKTIVTDLTAFRGRISEIDSELNQLQPLMERAGVLQAQIDAANEASSRLDGERAHLDAVQHLLETETFAQDIREQLATLAERRAEIGYDRVSHDTARQQLDIYREYEKRQTELEIAINSLPDAQTQFETAQLRLERTMRALDEDRKGIENLEIEKARLEVLLQEFQSRQQEANQYRSAERAAYSRLVNARQELDALDKQRTRKVELQERAEQKRREQTLYNELKLAFGKNGIPAMVIETAIPELESAANALLARMTGGRMNLAFNTQREKVTGGMAETLEIQIADELGTRSYEMYSGGEAFRINFAIRVALSQLLARRAGAHLRTLFLDEGFGTQDEDGRNRLVEAITAIQDDFDLILVITHIDELRDSFPVHIVVEKTPNGSRVSVR